MARSFRYDSFIHDSSPVSRRTNPPLDTGTRSFCGAGRHSAHHRPPATLVPIRGDAKAPAARTRRAVRAGPGTIPSFPEEANARENGNRGTQSALLYSVSIGHVHNRKQSL